MFPKNPLLFVLCGLLSGCYYTGGLEFLGLNQSFWQPQIIHYSGNGNYWTPPAILANKERVVTISWKRVCQQVCESTCTEVPLSKKDSAELFDDINWRMILDTETNHPGFPVQAPIPDEGGSYFSIYNGEAIVSRWLYMSEFDDHDALASLATKLEGLAKKGEPKLCDDHAGFFSGFRPDNIGIRRYSNLGLKHILSEDTYEWVKSSSEIYRVYANESEFSRRRFQCGNHPMEDVSYLPKNCTLDLPK